ncbi:hypothetical protein [Halioxenophilus aromaticivorans]|uniref:Uncharacterized protein n=1 Tax=Halioxenophilus aromaticivorans TaxID=1306992 RepID=A0AAV3TVH8_9ALTE
MPVLSSATLHCSDTEDRRYDDTRLDVHVDDQPVYSLRRNVRAGEDWNLNRQVAFQRSVTLRLWDEDNASSDDNLGTTEISSSLGTGRFAFTLDGADYSLEYSVLDDNRTSVEVAWDGLNGSTHAGEWPQFVVREFHAQIGARLQTPELIN